MAKKNKPKKDKAYTQYYKGKHYFQKYLASLGTDLPLAPFDQRAEGKRFFRAAKVHIIDAYEFKDFIIGRKVTGQMADLPFEQTWIEFNDYSIARPNSLTWIYGIGFDKNSKTIHVCLSTEKNGPIEFLQITENADDIALLVQLICFLKPEFVNATTRSARIGHTLRNGKRIDHISEYILVYRKKPKTVTKDLADCPVDWQHRWHQSGHWRKIKGTGRDADGNEVEGRTWIKSCVKGPEDKPLVNKIRVVKDSLPPDFQQYKGASA